MHLPGSFTTHTQKPSIQTLFNPPSLTSMPIPTPIAAVTNQPATPAAKSLPVPYHSGTKPDRRTKSIVAIPNPSSISTLFDIENCNLSPANKRSSCKKTKMKIYDDTSHNPDAEAGWRMINTYWITLRNVSRQVVDLNCCSGGYDFCLDLCALFPGIDVYVSFSVGCYALLLLPPRRHDATASSTESLMLSPS